VFLLILIDSLFGKIGRREYKYVYPSTDKYRMVGMEGEDRTEEEYRRI